MSAEKATAKCGCPVFRARVRSSKTMKLEPALINHTYACLVKQRKGVPIDSFYGTS